jgi:hypothetical protein
MTGLKQVAINSIEDLLNALNFGSSIRQTDATAVNARSSPTLPLRPSPIWLKPVSCSCNRHLK